MDRYLCIDIGGTSIKYASFSGEGLKLIDTQELKTPSGELILDALYHIIDPHLKGEALQGIAISSAGVVDPVSGTLVYAGPTIPNYTGTTLKASIEKRYGLPVAVENDVNAALLGEYWKGAAKGSSSTFMFTVGTGIGGAFMIGDTLWHGSSLSAGEVGYLNLNGTHFQNEAASSIMVKEVSKTLNQDLDGAMIFKLAQEGQQDCIDAIDALINKLSLGISDIMYLLNPETVLLGGGIMHREQYLKPLVNKAVDAVLIDPRFKSKTLAFAKCGNDAGMIGALYHLLQSRKV